MLLKFKVFTSNLHFQAAFETAPSSKFQTYAFILKAFAEEKPRP